MSQVDLNALRDGHVFDPAPSLEEMYQYHVPFDELVGTASCEAPLRRAIDRGEQVALVGDSGSGKSSVIRHVLGPLVEGVAPLSVPVSVEDPQVVSDPVRFAAHLVRTVARYVEHAMPGAAEAAKDAMNNADPVGPSQLRRRKIGGAIGWLSNRLELASELEQVTAPQARGTAEILDQARQVLALITARDLEPVLVFDDTDKWFGAGTDDADALIAGFFGPVVRLLAEDLGVTSVLAVHNEYLRHPGYARAAGFIESTVRVPRLPTADALGKLLRHRTAGQRVLEAEALAGLFAYYNQGQVSDLRRRVLLIVHTALSHACDDGADRIGVRHLELAVAEYGESTSWWRRAKRRG